MAFKTIGRLKFVALFLLTSISIHAQQFGKDANGNFKANCVAARTLDLKFSQLDFGVKPIFGGTSVSGWEIQNGERVAGTLKIGALTIVGDEQEYFLTGKELVNDGFVAHWQGGDQTVSMYFSWDSIVSSGEGILCKD